MAAIQKLYNSMKSGALQITDNGCWILNGKTSGYHNIRSGGKYKKLHRTVFEEIHGPIHSGWYVRHLCNIRGCVNPEHLATGTIQENIEDARRTGAFMARTHRPNPSKTTKEQRAEIVEAIEAVQGRRQRGSLVRSLASKYRCDRHTIYRAVRMFRAETEEADGANL